MNRLEAEKKLKDIFGFEYFFDDQWKSIEKILEREKILLIEKTGFGKSLTFQFPSTQFDGLTIIFSPLIALMRNQIESLNNKGIRVGLINSEQSDEENMETIQKAINNELKILYIAPERQENSIWQEAVQKMNISFIVIDEAHCISIWGHNFRPAFRRIVDLVKLLPSGIPILATTATATKEVEEDIKNQIGGNIEVIRGNLIRENLKLNVVYVNSEEDKMAWSLNYLNKVNGNGIIYTGTRSSAEIFSKWFESQKLNTIYYHAGIDGDNRKVIEKKWMDNSYKAVVSTNALGMGIDKADIRFIIHTQIPQSPIHYYQEIGRAGRDGELSEIFLLFNPDKDIDLPKSFIENTKPSIDKYERVINALKQEPLAKRELVKTTNLKQNQVTVIIADLLEQNIVREVKYGSSKKYEYQYNAPQLNTTTFENLKKQSLSELDKIIEYTKIDNCKMLFLCNYLDDSTSDNCEKCDSCLGEKQKFVMSDEDKKKIKEFQENFFPTLETATVKTKNYKKYTIKLLNENSIYATIDNIEVTAENIEKLSDKDIEIIHNLENELRNETILIDGIASSYYGFSNIGSIIHKCKYENGGDFPKILLGQTLRAFNKYFKNQKFDIVLFVPPTVSGKLVENFATKIANILNIPIYPLIKIRETKEQKMFENSALKAENVKDAFDIEIDIIDKRVLLIDDIYDSGKTIKEIGKILTKKGAKIIAPLVIAKTIGGDVAE